MNKQTHPEKWYIEVTTDNYQILKPWHSKKTADTPWLDDLTIGYLLLSEHPSDTSCYWSGDKDAFNYEYPDYKKITLEQFKQAMGIDITDITISRDILNQYYEAATADQREYINKHFTVGGKTTVESIRGLYDIACSKWKIIIKTNHPHCFPVTKSPIELAVERIGENVFGCRRIEIKDDHILVPLPNANKEWTFQVFKYVMDFCKAYPHCYPVHRSGHDNANYLYIKWND